MFSSSKPCSHRWREDRRHRGAERDTVVVELSCRRCGEVTSRSLTGVHQHEWETVRKVEVEYSDHAPGGGYSSGTRIAYHQQCKGCGTLRSESF